MAEYYKVGVAIKNGVPEEQWEPAIIYDGDTVLCTFPGSKGKEQARAVCELLNTSRRNSPFLSLYHC